MKEFNKNFMINTEHTGRVIVKSLSTGKVYYIEESLITPENGFAQKWLEVNRINSKIISLQKEDSVEKILDYIFNTFDDLLITKQFDIVNNLLEIIEINELNIDTIVGILTITSNWKDELNSRNSYYQKAYEYINELHLNEETNEILGGLK